MAAKEKNKNELTPLMQQYYNIKAQYPDVILFFRLGDFYELFGEDAVNAHGILEVVLTKKQETPMCGVPFHSINNYIKKLVKAGFKIAICEQLEDASASKGIVKRGVVRVITPGTLIEDNLLEARQNNFLMAIILNKKTNSVSVAVADISTGDFFVYETQFKNMENEISKYRPNEILLSETDSKNETLKSVLDNFSVTASPVKDMYVDFVYAESFIKNKLNVTSLSQFNIDGKIGIISAAGAIFAYVNEKQPQSLPIFTNIRFLETTEYMLLDSVAIKNLEILRTLSNLKYEGSLLSAIDTTCTPMGARLLRNWLIKPLLNVDEIKYRQSRIALFIENNQLRDDLRENLKSVSDMDRIVSRIISATANPKEVLALKDSLQTIKDILVKLQPVNYFMNTDVFLICDEIINKIEVTINPQAPITIKDGGVINTGVYSELDELRLLSKDAKKYISELEQKEKEKTGINNLRIGYTSVFGYYIEVTKSHVNMVPAEYVRKQTLTNSERYITHELKTLEEKIISAQDRITRIENELFSALRQEIADKSKYILEIAYLIAELDIYLSFADNAVAYNYCCPEVNSGRELILEESRHPVVEQLLKSGSFVANDISLNDSARRIIILTGPNMSGKSTYLRQIALIVIMAQIGSYVPCSKAVIGIVDRIFTRIGAGDNLAAGESTFMVEMTETANILNQYTDRSLIILDEVGRGTSTYDGMSIAWAILESFSDINSKYNKGAKVLFATHYFELTSLASDENGIINSSVSVKEWNGNVIFLHKIVDGWTDKSYGIHVAKIAGIPYKVIKRAYEILHGLEKNMNRNFSKLEEDLQPNLFSSVEPEIITELKKVNIDELTPMSALNLLSDWKKKYSD